MEKDLLYLKKNINNWKKWFIGFMDADGNFQVFKKKRSNKLISGDISEYYNVGYGIHISLSERDIILLEEINNLLNFINNKNNGKLYHYPEKEEARLAFTKLEDIKFLIDNIFDNYNLKTLTQYNRYNLLRTGINNSIKRFENKEEFDNWINKILTVPAIKQEEIVTCLAKKNTVQESYDLGNWILGFITGEGNFHVHKKGHCVFSIEHTDLSVLILIKNFLNFGPAILSRGQRYYKAPRSAINEFKENLPILRKATYVLTISSKKDLQSLIDLCENPNLIGLRGHKLIQYKIWYTAYES